MEDTYTCSKSSFPLEKPLIDRHLPQEANEVGGRASSEQAGAGLGVTLPEACFSEHVWRFPPSGVAEVA
jgi:hypothetical protein